jgi:hypothetical protein
MEEINWTMCVSNRKKKLNYSSASAEKINIFIPRILTNVPKTMMVNVFAQRNIGKVVYIDAKFRTNNEKNEYGFVFMTIELFRTKEAVEFKHEIRCNLPVQIVYDAPLYWEVKQYLPREQRVGPEQAEDQGELEKQDEVQEQANEKIEKNEEKNQEQIAEQIDFSEYVNNMSFDWLTESTNTTSIWSMSSDFDEIEQLCSRLLINPNLKVDIVQDDECAFWEREIWG